MIVAIETDSFSLAETDVSSLAVGEAETIETESGQVVDILRTPDGVEVYIDGELVDVGLDHDHEAHQVNMIRKHVEIICDEEDDCDKHVVIHANDKVGHQDAEHVIIHEDIDISCEDEDGEDCSERVILLTGDEQIEIEELLEQHVGGEEHKVIVIKTRKDGD
jgi:hypothetical protein